jgi:hypothetical protein
MEFIFYNIYYQINNMTKKQLSESIRKIIRKHLNEMKDNYGVFQSILDAKNCIRNLEEKGIKATYITIITEKNKKGYKVIPKEIKENQPAPTKPQPTIHPGKPTEKPGPRRPLIKPNIQPKPKAIKENEIIDKIVKRFKSKK